MKNRTEGCGRKGAGLINFVNEWSLKSKAKRNGTMHWVLVDKVNYHGAWVNNSCTTIHINWN